ncbi:MAG: hypothetical protein IH613_08295 [Desulfuromonadales bacterium]|nr:hypothetical protein [Desulfuromonadales bacterium]
MIENQLRSRGVKDPPVLRPMKEVLREMFLPEGMAAFIYEDSQMPSGEVQTISQPFTDFLLHPFT